MGKFLAFLFSVWSFASFSMPLLNRGEYSLEGRIEKRDSYIYLIVNRRTLSEFTIKIMNPKLLSDYLIGTDVKIRIKIQENCISACTGNLLALEKEFSPFEKIDTSQVVSSP